MCCGKLKRSREFPDSMILTEGHLCRLLSYYTILYFSVKHII